MFDRINGVSPVAQDFVWLAEYYNGNGICEFDFKTKQKNDFYKIDRSLVSKFGLIGQGMKLYFDVSTGFFNLNGSQIIMTYKTKDREYHLTGHKIGLYNDIITYKDAHTDANLRNPNEKFVSHIHQYNFGYKKKLSFDDGLELNFQAIVSLPYNSPASMEIKIVPNMDLEGELYIKRVGAITEPIQAPLRKGYAGMTNWTIK